MKKSLIIAVTLFLSQILFAQTLFNFRYGTTLHDDAKKVIQTLDGNYLVCGMTEGFGSGGNAFVMKVNSLGAVLWIKDYSGINYDEIFDAIELLDSTVMLCGSTGSFGAGNNDAFVMKIDKSGNMLWAKSYGNINSDYFFRIAEDGLNGFYVAGYAQKISGNVEGSDIVRMDSMGNIIWSKWVASWSHQGGWYPTDMTPISSGGVMLGGVGNGIAVACWKFSSSGNLIWSNQYTSSAPNSSGLSGLSILENTNGEILINFCGANANTVAHSVDNFILKIDSSGNSLSFKSYGGTYVDWSRTISNTTDGGIIITGFSNSAGNGDYDAYLIKLEPNGAIEWAKAYGSVWYESPAMVIQTFDKGFILTGKSFSFGSNYDSCKVHLVKTDSLGNSSCKSIAWTPIENNQSATISSALTPDTIILQTNIITWAVNNRVFYNEDICNLSSISQLNNSDNFLIYPNPFNSFISIKKFNIKLAKLTIKNVLGESVFEIKGDIFDNTGSTILDLSFLPCGIYLLDIIGGKTRIVNKIIKQ